MKPLILATILVGAAAVASSADAAVVCREGLNATHCQDGRDRYTIRHGPQPDDHREERTAHRHLLARPYLDALRAALRDELPPLTNNSGFL